MEQAIGASECERCENTVEKRRALPMCQQHVYMLGTPVTDLMHHQEQYNPATPEDIAEVPSALGQLQVQSLQEIGSQEVGNCGLSRTDELQMLKSAELSRPTNLQIVLLVHPACVADN